MVVVILCEFTDVIMKHYIIVFGTRWITNVARPGGRRSIHFDDMSVPIADHVHECDSDSAAEKITRRCRDRHVVCRLLGSKCRGCCSQRPIKTFIDFECRECIGAASRVAATIRSRDG